MHKAPEKQTYRHIEMAHIENISHAEFQEEIMFPCTTSAFANKNYITIFYLCCVIILRGSHSS